MSVWIFKVNHIGKKILIHLIKISELGRLNIILHNYLMFFTEYEEHFSLA